MAAESATANVPVLIDKSSGLGLITLNRPQVINALTHEMVGLIQRALDDWADDDEVATIVLDGAGERGLCAGGDVRAMYLDALAGGGKSQRFWADEYRLNASIAGYHKPVVALMDGIVMGGGVGLAGHASHRVVNETSVIAMPEVGIGFIPDVGGSYLLAHAPGELGTHVGLAGARMSGADAIYCGFADFYVAKDRGDELRARLSVDGPDAALAQLCSEPPPSELAAQQQMLDACYGADTVEEILARLTASQPSVAATVARQSPTALKVTLASLRAARGDSDLSDSLLREFRVSLRSLGSHDFIEGIRAQLIDKDRNPQWQPARLADVRAEAVDRFFETLGDDELSLAGEVSGVATLTVTAPETRHEAEADADAMEDHYLGGMPP